MTLSDRLRQLRRSRGWTQGHLCGLLAERGITYTRAAISSWERQGLVPAITTIRALAQIYGLTAPEEFQLYRLASSPSPTGADQLDLVAPPKGSDAA